MPSARRRSHCAARSSGTRACSSAHGTTFARSSGESRARQRNAMLPMPARRGGIVGCPPSALLTKEEEESGRANGEASGQCAERVRRSEERRVGKECRGRGAPYHEKREEKRAMTACK